jgi:alpha-L-rhamnosidase
MADCTLKAQNVPENSAKNLSGACWIGGNESKLAADSLMFGNLPAPLFRREFTVSGKADRAILTITAAGYYLASVNGNMLKDNVLDPAWTNFGKRIYCSTYDVTSWIRKGENVLGIRLGNGFYNSLPLKLFGKFNLRDYLPTGEPQFIARLQLTYSNGSVEEIVSDKNWKTAAGPIVKNNVYLGETYDARLERSGWDSPGFDDHQWKSATQKSGPGGEIQPSFFPPVKIARTIKPVQIRQNGKTIIVDMGVNLTGSYRIRLKGDRGDTIAFRFGERLFENGSLNPMTTVAGQIKRKGAGGKGSPDIAWQTDSYIFGNEQNVQFQPRFTFHAFRYMEIHGLKYMPLVEDIEAIEFHTAVENENRFDCSSKLLNDIQKVCRQTFLNNLITVQSDCPAREKFGYGGDLNATSDAFIFNFGMQSFYRKTIYDWADAMQDSIFIDTAPYVGIKYCGISWESTFLITQYKLLQYYGDTAIVNEMYQKDLGWMDKVRKLHPEEIVNKGLSDHESMEKVPVQLIGTTHYLDCARIMKKFAEIRKDARNMARFAKLEQSLTGKLLDLFWHQPVADRINRQTLFATLIYYHIIPKNELAAATDSLLKAVKRAPARHFTTGIFGTKYILEALSMTGHTDEVFRIVNSTAFPGWGHMIDRGATTLWETWKESDNVYSNCHPMFGTVSEWYFRWLAGIRPADHTSGFKYFLVAPSFPVGLNSANSVYCSPYGKISVEWKRDLQDKIEIRVGIPQGASAQFAPSGNTRKSWKVTNVNTNISSVRDLNSQSVELKSGEYLLSDF